MTSYASPPTAGSCPTCWRDGPRLTSGRRLLGIAGAPGAGKSTLAAAVAGAVPGSVVVPMDGFHLADVELRRRGLLDRKGAPETFDGWGYAALLGPAAGAARPRGDGARLRARPRAAAGRCRPGAARGSAGGHRGQLPAARRVAEWRAVRAQLDVVWLVRTDDLLRKRSAGRPARRRSARPRRRPGLGGPCRRAQRSAGVGRLAGRCRPGPRPDRLGGLRSTSAASGCRRPRARSRRSCTGW